MKIMVPNNLELFNFSCKQKVKTCEFYIMQSMRLNILSISEKTQVFILLFKTVSRSVNRCSKVQFKTEARL